MNEEQEQWLDDVLQSAQAKKVVVPRADLFESIQLALEKEPALVFSHWTKTWMVAAALLIGLLNIFAFQQILSSNYTSNADTELSSNYESLVSDYNFYK
ncbi:MAG: hypothetical protein AB8E82_06810 [Aureispira sp.]